MSLIEIGTVILTLIGVVFMVLASIGVLRFPDIYTRMHAAGKSGTLGIIGVLLGIALFFANFLSAAKMIALIVFFLLTVPVAGHMLDRAAYLTGVATEPHTDQDDLDGRYDMETGRLL
jgi:multicomponent Na+:H+ antiporter subunit G